MSTQAEQTSIRTEVVVEAPQDRAFSVFTEQFDKIKPRELEHRHLDRHGEGWEGLREGVAGDQGWPLYLGRFADQVT